MGTPRFVLGRAREGVVWRFRADLDPALVVEIGRLAAREKGFPIDGVTEQAPERLAAIVKRLARHDVGQHVGGRSPHSSPARDTRRSAAEAASVRHEWVSRDRVVVGELWIVG